MSCVCELIKGGLWCLAYKLLCVNPASPLRVQATAVQAAATNELQVTNAAVVNVVANNRLLESQVNIVNANTNTLATGSANLVRAQEGSQARVGELTVQVHNLAPQLADVGRANAEIAQRVAALPAPVQDLTAAVRSTEQSEARLATAAENLTNQLPAREQANVRLEAAMTTYTSQLAEEEAAQARIDSTLRRFQQAETALSSILEHNDPNSSR